MAATPRAPVAVSERWDEIVVDWPGDSPQQWRRQSDAVNRELIERWLPGPYESLLKTDLFDEFAGDGLYRCLAGRTRRVIGTDVSPELVARVQAKYPGLEAVAADVRHLPFGDASFEAVLSNSTLDHFSDEEQATRAFAELARVMRPGGRLLVTLDNPVNPLIAVRNRLPCRVAHLLRRVPFEAGWTCGPRRLGQILNQAGFEVVATTAVLHAPRSLLAFLDRRGIRGRTLMGVALGMERLQRWPTRYLTGHYVGAVATRRTEPGTHSEPRRTARGAVARARQIRHELGPAGLGWKVLGELGFRRALLFKRELDAIGEESVPSLPIQLSVLQPDDLDDYVRFRPDADPVKHRRRLDAGHRCHVVRLDGRIVATRWVAFREARVEYLGLTFPLSDGEAYLYDAYTAPDVRGRGLARALGAAIAARLRSEGYTHAASAAIRENPAGRGLNSSTSRPVATLVSLAVGRLRLHLRRPPPRPGAWERWATAVIERLMIAAQTSRAPAVAVQLHAILSAGRLRPAPSRRCRGRVGGMPVHVLCVGRERRFTALLERLLEEVDNVHPAPRVSAAQPRELSRLDADLTAVEIHPWVAGRFRDAGWTILPERVRWRAEAARLPPSRPSTSLQSDLKKALAYSVEHAGDPHPEDWREFHRAIVLPHARRRFGERAWEWSRPYVRWLEHRGELMFAVQHGRRLAGVCVVRTRDDLWIALAGVRNGEPGLLRDGSLSALYAAVLERARSSGVSCVDAGCTAPFLRDGLARYKRKWGFEPADDPLSPLIAFRVSPGHPELRRALEELPLLTRT